MMVVYLQVAGGRDLEVKEPVPAEALKHVIEKGHAGIDGGDSSSIELQRDVDLRLARLAADGGMPWCRRRHSCRRGDRPLTGSRFNVICHGVIGSDAVPPAIRWSRAAGRWRARAP